MLSVNRVKGRRSVFHPHLDSGGFRTVGVPFPIRCVWRQLFLDVCLSHVKATGGTDVVKSYLCSLISNSIMSKCLYKSNYRSLSF